MAEERPKDETLKVSDSEVAETLSGPAFHSNRLFCSTVAAGLRITFAEQLGERTAPAFRAAIIIAFPDAIALRDLLTHQLKEIEPQIKEMEKQAAAAMAKDASKA